MRVLILGGSGFIGSHIVDAILAVGATVRVFDRESEKFRTTPSSVEFVRGDFSDSIAIAEAMTDVDIVFHCLSTTMPSSANFDPISDVQGNLIGTIRLLEVMRAQGVSRLLFLSSGGTVYGVPNIDPVPENHALAPISSYGIVKTAIENYIQMESRLHGLEAVILRPSNPYGPRQGHNGVQGVIGTYMSRTAQSLPMQLWGDGSIVRDFLYVTDLADVCVACAQQKITGVYNVGAGEGRSIRDIIDGISEVSGRNVVPEQKTGRGFDVPRIVLDISAIKAATGWQPRVSFKEGLSKTWEWVRSTSE